MASAGRSCQRHGAAAGSRLEGGGPGRSAFPGGEQPALSALSKGCRSAPERSRLSLLPGESPCCIAAVDALVDDGGIRRPRHLARQGDRRKQLTPPHLVAPPLPSAPALVEEL